MAGDKMVETLKCSLNDHEKIEKGDRLAELVRVRNETDEKRKRDNSRLQDRIKGITAEIEQIAEAVELGWEYREVECELRYDYEHALTRKIRLDTYEEIQVRAMLDHERQIGLFLPVPEEHAHVFDKETLTCECGAAVGSDVEAEAAPQ